MKLLTSKFAWAMLLTLLASPLYAQIKVYTMNGCGRCAYTVKYLTENNIAFTELNTTTNQANNMAMWDLLAGKASGSISMPVVDNNGEVAFSIPDLNKYLKNLGSKATKNTDKPTPITKKEETSSADEVIIYQHANYEGKSQRLKVGKYNMQQLSIGNDQLSSAKVPENLVMVLYEHSNFGGSSMELSGEFDYIGDDFNDKTSSIEIMLASDAPQPEEHEVQPEETPVVEPKPTNVNAKTFKGCATGKENIPAENEAFEKKVMEIVNAERKKVGKPAMTWDANLARAARYHAADMATEGYFAHDSFDVENGVETKVCDTFDRISKFGKGYAENIAAGSTSPEGAMNQWMNSPGHKRNILSDNTTIGVGLYKGYWVQVFGVK